MTSFMRTGMIIPWASDIAPPGYLLCDGRRLNKNDFPNLYSAIGYTYSTNTSGDMFNIPDIRSRCIIGSPSSQMLGVKVGKETHVLTVNELPAHNHGGGNHTHRYDISGAGQGTKISEGAAGIYYSKADDLYDRRFESTNPSSMIQSSGGNQPHENMQPYVALYYYIKY